MSKFKSETSIGYMSLEKGKIKILKKKKNVNRTPEKLSLKYS